MARPVLNQYGTGFGPVDCAAASRNAVVDPGLTHALTHRVDFLGIAATIYRIYVFLSFLHLAKGYSKHCYTVLCRLHTLPFGHS